MFVCPRIENHEGYLNLTRTLLLQPWNVCIFRLQRRVVYVFRVLKFSHRKNDDGRTAERKINTEGAREAHLLYVYVTKLSRVQARLALDRFQVRLSFQCSHRRLNSNYLLSQRIRLRDNNKPRAVVLHRNYSRQLITLRTNGKVVAHTDSLIKESKREYSKIA